MSASIFITRQLSEDSPIREVTRKFDQHITSFSLINFTSISFIAPSTQWIFFYSKTGVEKFHNAVGENIRQYSIGCFGSQTAQYCSKLAEVAFHANANVDKAITLINTNILENDVTFVCGRNSLRSVQKSIKRSMPEIIVYENEPQQLNRKLWHYSVAMITSPMNLTSFLNNNGSADNYISIGHTTAKACSDMGIKSLVSQHPSEEGMADILEKLLDNDHA